jgi:hypothetical protein
MAAGATALIIYTEMSVPQDIAPFVTKDTDHDFMFDRGNSQGRIFSSLMKLYWMIIVVIYLLVSFFTMAWHITWLIWLVGGAIAQAIKMIYEINNSNGAER